MGISNQCCPSSFPHCYSDGDCVTAACAGGGCSWSWNTNYISGCGNGQRCTSATNPTVAPTIAAGACSDSDRCLAARPGWAGYTCSISQAYCTSSNTVWAQDMNGCCPVTCSSCSGSAPTSAPSSSSATCCPSGSCSTVVSACGALSTQTDCWSGGYCYADSVDDCCEVNGGAIAGIVIGLLVCCVLLPIAGCCFFCGSCPLAKSRNQETVVHVQQIQPPPASQPIAPAPIVHQQVQPPPQPIPMAAQPYAMVAEPTTKQEAPPMSPPPPGQSGVQYAAAPPPPPYQPPPNPARFCASCGLQDASGAATFCASWSKIRMTDLESL